jgi:ABC-type amino acid transport substrate-binding protein
MRGWLAEAAVALATAVTIACGTGTSRQTKGADQFVLRVGVSPEAPPIAFMREGRIVGVEPDLAQALVNHFQRPLALVPMDWQSLIPALLAGPVDAIMSGMTITQAREVRVALADPYMRSGLAPLRKGGRLVDAPGRGLVGRTPKTLIDRPSVKRLPESSTPPLPSSSSV